MVRQDPDHMTTTDLFGEQVSKQTTSALRRRFIFPPFSVLNTRDGDWQRRKRLWLKLGIQSELGRGQNALRHSDYPGNVDFYAQKRKLEAELGEELTTDEALRHLLKLGRAHTVEGRKSERIQNERRTAFDQSASGYETSSNDPAAWQQSKSKRRGRPLRTNAIVNSKAVEKYPYFAGRGGGMDTSTGDGTQSGSSIFDPTLTELMYTWFCPPGGMVVDAFAGGSVRGIVAAVLSRRYWGSELRAEQVEANVEQGKTICPRADLTWMCGDSYDLLPDAPHADFLFTCPPYGDLEEYSDDPRDISTMTYGAFRKRFRQIIRRSARRLKQNRFAAIIVGDFRDRKTGMLRGFVGDTVVAFEDAGLEFYNDIILITAIGSLPIRVRKQFEAGRKIGKTHQNVLVFVKGDPRKAAVRCE